MIALLTLFFGIRQGLGLGLGLLLYKIKSNQQILGGVGVKVMHCRADAPRSNPTRAILNFFSLKIEET